jgi:homoserine O-acetyltransferase
MNVAMKRTALFVCLVTLPIQAIYAADYPQPTPGDFVLRNFDFTSGRILFEPRLHYYTLGTPQRDRAGVVRNAVLILHGTTGSGQQFLRPEFAGELFGKGQLLDATRYYLILPDGIGHGGSSKPSDGLRAGFPRYGYRDMITAQYRLLTEGLQVNHLRLVIGTSMGGMHTWLWGEKYPYFMDALLPQASLPTQISGRNRLWRRMIIDAIRHDPVWQGGTYQKQPPSLITAAEMLMFMSTNPVVRQQEAPTRRQADQAIDTFVTRQRRSLDANDVLYALESSSDYDPGPELEKIRAPLLAINFADDLINPPELGILEREIKRVRGGRAILIRASAQTRGHGTHTLAAVWKSHLAELLKQTDPAEGKDRTNTAFDATDQEKQDERRLAGVWVEKADEYEGQAGRATDDDRKLTIVGKKYTFSILLRGVRDRTFVDVGTFRVDPSWTAPLFDGRQWRL